MFTILGRLSSINVRKVVWTACECGIDIDLDTRWGDSSSLKDPAFLALNPNGQIPVLRTPDGDLWESNSICRYLATISNRHDLLPSEPMARARVERWMDWQATDLNSAWRPAFVARFRNVTDLPEQLVTDSINSWRALQGLVSRTLGDEHSYIEGDHFTLADIVIALSYQRWLHMDIDAPELAPMTSWYNRVTERPGFTRYLDRTTP